METSSFQMDGIKEARPLFQNKLKMMNIKEEELTVMPEDIFDLYGLWANGICWNIGVKMERNWKVGRLNTKLLNFDLMLCVLKK